MFVVMFKLCCCLFMCSMHGPGSQLKYIREQPHTDTAAKTHDDSDDGENETVIGEQSVKTKTRDEQV